MCSLTGPAVVKSLFKNRSNDGQHKVLTCEAEGSPKPAVSWSINGTVVCTLYVLGSLPIIRIAGNLSLDNCCSF